jgi:hypothetical protein
MKNTETGDNCQKIYFPSARPGGEIEENFHPLQTRRGKVNLLKYINGSGTGNRAVN